MVKPKFDPTKRLVAKFKAPDGAVWRVYHADRRHHRELFDVGERFLAVGVSVFKGKHRHKIFIDSRRSPSLVFDTTLHEIMHIALRDLGLDRMVEESFVEALATRVAFMLEQL